MSWRGIGLLEICGSSDGRCTGVYRRRRPERTVLYQVVQCHLESWLAQYREAEPGHDPIPWCVERDFRRYLDCGLLF